MLNMMRGFFFTLMVNRYLRFQENNRRSKRNRAFSLILILCFESRKPPVPTTTWLKTSWNLVLESTATNNTQSITKELHHSHEIGHLEISVISLGGRLQLWVFRVASISTLNWFTAFLTSSCDVLFPISLVWTCFLILPDYARGGGTPKQTWSSLK